MLDKYCRTVPHFKHSQTGKVRKGSHPDKPTPQRSRSLHKHSLHMLHQCLAYVRALRPHNHIHPSIHHLTVHTYNPIA